MAGFLSKSNWAETASERFDRISKPVLDSSPLAKLVGTRTKEQIRLMNEQSYRNRKGAFQARDDADKGLVMKDNT